MVASSMFIAADTIILIIVVLGVVFWISNARHHNRGRPLSGPRVITRWQCSHPDCRETNPARARYCRRCGQRRR